MVGMQAWQADLSAQNRQAKFTQFEADFQRAANLGETVIHLWDEKDKIQKEREKYNAMMKTKWGEAKSVLDDTDFSELLRKHKHTSPEHSLREAMSQREILNAIWGYYYGSADATDALHRARIIGIDSAAAEAKLKEDAELVAARLRAVGGNLLLGPSTTTTTTTSSSSSSSSSSTTPTTTTTTASATPITPPPAKHVVIS